MAASSTKSVAVFCGPSLPPQDRIATPGVSYLRPASRGDVLAAAKAHDAVVLIDGVFHHDLAPAPKECYEATLHAQCFGASSMGALRAAECAPYGFLPLGAIARWFAFEQLDGDDEVAVLTHPDDDRALTVPVVNVRYAVRIAQRRGLLTPRESLEIVTRSRAVYYMDRTWDDVLAVAPPHARAGLSEIAESQADLKRHDARFALRGVLRRFAMRGTVKA